MYACFRVYDCFIAGDTISPNQLGSATFIGKDQWVRTNEEAPTSWSNEQEKPDQTSYEHD